MDSVVIQDTFYSIRTSHSFYLTCPSSIRCWRVLHKASFQFASHQLWIAFSQISAKLTQHSNRRVWGEKQMSRDHLLSKINKKNKFEIQTDKVTHLDPKIPNYSTFPPTSPSYFLALLQLEERKISHFSLSQYQRNKIFNPI